MNRLCFYFILTVAALCWAALYAGYGWPPAVLFFAVVNTGNTLLAGAAIVAQERNP